ncbi:Phosphoenolpyruvate synthase regulatory protein [hydrothermal vent metagenome]|uniref:Phosphoenolpyruvate synthase regulatory protein n=1 Tax=hydrothermal vent metagenome TaxID=652676 RepID=A0A3B1AD85_9ZZZZ
MQYNVYYISDCTAITAESFGKTVLSQFDTIHFKQVSYRFIDDNAKALKLSQEIDSNSVLDKNLPIIFSTLVNPELRAIVAKSNGHFFDLFNLLIPKLESILNSKASFNSGLAHGNAQDANYEQRMDAVNFALVHDDGVNVKHYSKADIILTGLSRSGKTPTSLYLAMHYGIYVANYPLTEENLTCDDLPTDLIQYQAQVFALTIQADRLHKIRMSRLPNSRYSSLNQCKLEIRQAEKLITKAKFPSLDVTSSSVEEIATTVLLFYNSK